MRSQTIQGLCSLATLVCVTACGEGLVPGLEDPADLPGGSDSEDTDEPGDPDEGSASDGASGDGDSDGDESDDGGGSDSGAGTSATDGGSGTDSDSEGGTDTDAPEPPEPGEPTRLVPLGFAGIAADPTGPAGTVLEAGLGAATPDPVGRVSNADHRVRLWMSGGHRPRPEPGVTLVGWVTDGFDVPVDDHALPMKVRGYEDPSLSEATLAFEIEIDAQVERGRVELHLGPDAATALAAVPEAFLEVEIEGQSLAPGIRVGAMPRAVRADQVSAGGILLEEGEQLPAEAVERNARIVQGYYRPGEDLRDLPGPGWTCHHETTVAGFPRVESVDDGFRCEDRNYQGHSAPFAFDELARVHLAAASVGDTIGTFHADRRVPIAFQYTPACGGGCPNRVVVHRYDLDLGKDCTLPADSPYVGRWTVHPVLEGTEEDPAADGVLVHVVSVCTRDAPGTP